MNSNRLQELIDAASEIPPSRLKIEMLESAINEADALGETSLGYSLRMQLIECAIFHGYGDRAITAFAWCLKYADQNEDEVSPEDYLWKYKWVLSLLPRLPQISKAKILQMVEDMGRRVEAAGFSPRPTYYVRWNALVEMGDFESATAEMEKWRPEPKDGLQDCMACETNSEVEFLAHSHQDEKALECAKPILAGRLKCAEVPHATLGKIIRPLLRLGRVEDAVKFGEKGYRLAAKNEEYLPEVSEYLLLATHTNQAVRAMRIFTKHASWALTGGIPSRRFHFSAAASAFLEKLASGKFAGQAETAPAKMSPHKSQGYKGLALPKSHPCYQVEQPYDPAMLAEWYRKNTEELAGQFDERNGNRYFSQRLEETYQLAGCR